MKAKKLLSFIVIAIMSITAVVFTGCNKALEKVVNGFTLSFSEAYDYSAISAVGILDSFDTPNVSTLASAEEAPSGSVQDPAPSGSNQNQNKTDLISEETKQAILDNLLIVNNSVSNGIIKSEVVASEKEGYEYSYSISATNAQGITSTYIFYYNETKTTDEEEEDEEEILMEGIVLLNEVEYTVVGSREIEEGEEEVSFKISIDENNYVIISQEFEEGEQEFKYMAFENGKKVLDTKIEYEYDEEDQSVEMKFKTKTLEEEVQYKYTFIQNETGSFIGVRIKTNKSNVKALIQVTLSETGEASYEFIKISQDTNSSDKELKHEYEKVEDYDDEDENED